MRFHLSPSPYVGASGALFLSLLFAQTQAGLVAYRQPGDVASRQAALGQSSAPGFSLQTRQATQCGKGSPGGDDKCGLNLCCSSSGWCGTTTDHCSNGCQGGFGRCNIAKPPACSPTGGSVNGRSVGYYQAHSTRSRKCQTVSPKQIKTQGLTHLFFAFAHINPSSYKVEAAEAADIPLMAEFTALKNANLKTWIAIGGGDFSLPDRPTHKTWSNMVSTAARRTTFINSLRAYMDQYGFTGVDLDWEYPGASDRGGKPEDTQNYVSLVREMRASFGTKYGISVILPPDYGYLQWFDPKAMEPHVDFFGFMSYDIHGTWEAAGGLMQGQADIRDIEKSALPLWFAGLNPSKINFGLAWYGRGYTLSDPKCNRLFHCTWKAPSKPGPCTGSPGIMSVREIQDLIKQKSLSPVYIAESLMKRISWDDQLIAYDDDQTIAAKKQWANSQCFGGTMYWSVDFQ